MVSCCFLCAKKNLDLSVACCWALGIWESHVMVLVCCIISCPTATERHSESHNPVWNRMSWKLYLQSALETFDLKNCHMATSTRSTYQQAILMWHFTFSTVPIPNGDHLFPTLPLITYANAMSTPKHLLKHVGTVPLPKKIGAFSIPSCAETMAGMAGVRLRGLQALREDLLDGLLKSCWLLDETNYHLIIFSLSPVFAMDQHCSFRIDVTKPVTQELAPCISCATLRCLTLNVAGDPFEWSPWGWHLCWTQTSLVIDWIWTFCVSVLFFQVCHATDAEQNN